MIFRHVPVLYDEVMESLNIRPDGFYVDGTTGGGGHSSGICERLSEAGILLAVDRDTAALEASQKRLEPYSCKKIFLHSNYSEVDRILETAGRPVDGILLDLGVSSFQLDTAERGFSYMHDAPMDMRMNEDDSFTAYNVVNEYDEKELHRIIKEYGEERWASRIAQFIVRRREEKPIDTTGELVEVNGELEHLKTAVERLPDILAPSGRLAIITFHSLEDRMVKEAFKARLNPCTCPPEFPVCVCGKKPDVRKVTRKPIAPGERELEENPRARSAKLRVIEKI